MMGERTSYVLMAILRGQEQEIYEVSIGGRSCRKEEDQLQHQVIKQRQRVQVKKSSDWLEKVSLGVVMNQILVS